jgi:hypothetical protein
MECGRQDIRGLCSDIEDCTACETFQACVTSIDDEYDRAQAGCGCRMSTVDEPNALVALVIVVVAALCLIVARRRT